MVKKIFSKKYLLPLLLTIIAGGLLWVGVSLTLLKFELESETPDLSPIPTSVALDLKFKAELSDKVEKAISIYSQKGWDKTRELLDNVGQQCRENNGCDAEVFFNDYLDLLANTLSNTKELTRAGAELGILYPSNTELTDIDGDQQNEVIVLQRDALGVNYILLKVIDFQEIKRVTSHKSDELGYFDSPNSSLIPAMPLNILDLTGDSIPEILLFLSSGRYGAQLFVFQYQSGELELIFKNDNLYYPEYTFSDTDGDGVLEILVEGYDPVEEKDVKQILRLPSF